MTVRSTLSEPSLGPKGCFGRAGARQGLSSGTSKTNSAEAVGEAAGTALPRNQVWGSAGTG
eukprot:4940936-Pyramimonas_sp.AAC.1